MARYALVVGISEYTYPLQNLSKPATDARAVAELLQRSNLFQEITLLTENVTGKELGEKLQTLLKQQAAKNEALIYFTGHCVAETGNLGQPRGFLVASDCKIARHDGQILRVNGGIALDELNDLIRQSDLSNLVVMLDCCHGEYFLERDLVRRLTAFSVNKDYYLITSCRSFEKSRAKKSDKHSIFTGALLAALSPDNADEMGVISGDRLFDTLSRKLKYSRQEPIHMGWGRSIPIVKYSIAAKAPTATDFRQDNPYRGLSAFGIAQAEYFYGRERAARELLDRLAQSQFIAAIGASGCGKSSLVKAGLLPLLQRDRLPESSQWDIELCTPGQQPLQTLLDILARQKQRDRPFLLFVDQFEELFTLCRDRAEQQQFVHLLSEAADNPKAKIAIAIRGDFLDRCTQFPEVVGRINSTNPPGTYLVTPLSRDELAEAIEKPATLHGVTYEPGLVAQIVSDVAEQPGALPLLQYALAELWRTCIENSSQPTLTWQGYEEIGRVQGALKRRANLLYESFSPVDRAFVRQLMMEMVQGDEGETITRKPANLTTLRAIADSPEQFERVMGQLTAQRLIVTDVNTIELAHEALLSEWNQFKDWIEEDREILRLKSHLQSDCREWQEKDKSQAYLLTGGRLAAVEDWMETARPKLPALEAEYWRKSWEKRDREQQAKLRQERRVWMLLAGLLAAIGLGGFIAAGFAQKGQVETLTVQTETYFKNHQQLEALQTSVKALDRLKKAWMNPVIVIHKNSYLERLQEVIYSVRERNILQANNILYGVDINPKSNDIASSGSDGLINLWTIEGEPLAPLQGHNGKWIWNVRFSHNGKLIASAGLDGTISVWDWNSNKTETQARQPKYTFVAQPEADEVSFSQDDRLLVSSGYDEKIILWTMNRKNTKNKKLEKELQTKISSLDLQPNTNAVIAYGGYDGSIGIWDWQNQTQKSIGNYDNGELTFIIRFNHDGTRLASAGNRGTIKIWDFKNPEKPQLLAEFKGHELEIRGIWFSSDNKELASSSSDNTIKLWKLEAVFNQYKHNKHIQQNEEIVTILQGHTDSVNRVAISHDQKFIVSASEDKTVRVWHYKPDLHMNNYLQVDKLYTDSCEFLRSYLKYGQSPDNEVKRLCSQKN